MGYLVFGLLLIVATVCAREICKPDEIELDDNKICVCSSGGTHWNCEVRDDPTSSSWSPRDRRDTTSKDHCEPGTSFKRFCNNCICGGHRQKSRSRCSAYSCDFTIWNEDGTRIQNNDTTIDHSWRTRPFPKEEFCVPGKTFKKYCNTCVCSASSLKSSAKCSELDCDLTIWNMDGTRKQTNETTIDGDVNKSDDMGAEERCEPGTEFKIFCNTCKCGSDGLVSRAECGKLFCDHANWNRNGTPKESVENSTNAIDKRSKDHDDEHCEPGSTFKIYCNNCKCGTDGLIAHASCSKLMCDRAEVNKDGTPRQTHEYAIYEMVDEGPAKYCIPDREFKRYCNTCQCGSDGLSSSATCTTDFCDHAMWAEDGTPKAEIEIVPMSENPRDSSQ